MRSSRRFHVDWDQAYIMNLKPVAILCLFVVVSRIDCTCDQYQFSCKTPDGKYGTCVNKTCVVIEAEKRVGLQFSVIVKYPESTLMSHGGKDLYMRGNALGLSWRTGLKLNKTGVDTWRTDITYSSAMDGFRCQNCSDNSTFTGHLLQYRVYIDDKVDMVGGNLQLKLPISQVSS